MMKGIIDRFEENLVVVEMEDGSTVPLARSLFPKETKVGQVVVIEGEQVTIDQEATKEREAKIKQLMKDVWAD